MNTPKERTEMIALAGYLDAIGANWFHPTSEGKRTPRQGWWAKKLGLSAGLPDAMIISKPKKGTDHTCGHAIELKRVEGGRTSNRQNEWIETLARNGWRVAVCFGANDAIAKLKEWGFDDSLTGPCGRANRMSSAPIDMLDRIAKIAADYFSPAAEECVADGVDAMADEIAELGQDVIDARRAARILLHAYCHDSRPPDSVLQTIEEWRTK